MRWLIWASLALALVGGAAHAATPTDLICAPHNSRWAKVSGGTDVRAMEAVVRDIPAVCPLRAQAERRLAELRRMAASKPSEVARRAPKPSQPDSEDDQLALATPPVAAPAVPLTPCSVAAIDAEDPGLPDDGPEPGLPLAKREDMARHYAHRAQAFDRCHDQANAQQYFAAAVSVDPQSFVAVAARARFELDHGALQPAVGDATAAIALKAHAPPDVNILGVYADRAGAYHALGQYAEEAADLKTVVDHFNDEAHDSLAPYSVYKERLAKAYVLEGDDPDAQQYFAATEEAQLDWQDQWYLGRMAVAKQDWNGALARLGKALNAAPPDGDHAQARAQIEVAIADIYKTRGQPGDIRAAWQSYRAAASDDPGNHAALTALGALGSPLPPPAFEEPTLDRVPMPVSADLLATARPGPFCDQAAKNDYLDSVKAAANAVSENMNRIAAYNGRLSAQRASYEGNQLLTYDEKIADLHVIDVEWQQLDAKYTDLRKTHDALGDYFNRVRDDASLIVFCKPPPPSH